MLQHKSCTVQCQFLNITCIKFWTKRTCFKCRLSQCQNFWKVLNNIQACQKWRKRNCCVVITLGKGPNNARPANGFVARNLTNSSLYRSHQSLDATSLDMISYSTLFLPDSDIRCIQVTTPRKRIILARKLRKDHKNDMKLRSHFPEYFFCLKKFPVQQGTQFGNSWFQEKLDWASWFQDSLSVKGLGFEVANGTW